MYVKIINNEIAVGPQSSKGDGDDWYLYQGVSPLDAASNEVIAVTINGEVATGVFEVDPNFSGVEEEYVRSIRNELLRNSDWTQLPDSPLNDAKKAEWAVYRQQLRDLPMTGDPDSITWPTKP